MLENSINMCKMYFDDLQETKNWFGFGKTFKTRNKFYYYDTGTGKIFEVKKSVYKLLSCILRTNNFNNLGKIGLSAQEIDGALLEIKNAVEEEHILLKQEMTSSSMSGVHVTQLEDQLENNLQQITLEVTERCNLRCDYCIYGQEHEEYRYFGKHDMSIETGSKSIDFIFSHNKTDEAYIGFYGGEPLLNFNLIHNLIKYALEKNVTEKKNIHFALTTNLTVLSREMARFFASVENLSIMVSIDGPKEIHDEHRIYEGGKGTFDTVEKNLGILIDEYNKSGTKSIISINSVLSYPYTEDKFNSMNRFFNSLPTSISPNIEVSYVSFDAKKEKYVPINERAENELDYDFNKQYSNPIEDWTNKDFDFQNQTRFTRNYDQTSLYIIHNRNIWNKPTQYYYLHGCCVPGARKAYITTDGNILPCERVGTVKPIGNIETGYDIFTIKKIYITDYINESLKFCDECWALTLCSSCYTECFNNEKDIDFSYRHANCSATRQQLEYDLVLYHEILEKAPHLIENLNKIQMV